MNTGDSKRNIVKRKPDRAFYDRDVINNIIDEALVCHIGFSIEGQPYVIPTIHARQGDRLLFHGLKGGRMLDHIKSGNDLCVTITLVDGIVLARSAFHHSMSYRSVVLFGTGAVIEDDLEKLEALRIITEHVVPGRWKDARPPDARELKATLVGAMVIADASAKIRDGLVQDDDEDFQLPVWAGCIPLRLQASAPVADPDLRKNLQIPEYALNYIRGAG